MKEVFVLLSGLFVLAMWRELLKFRCVQQCVSMTGPVKRLLQWYSILFIILTLLMLQNMYEAVKNNYIHLHFLDPVLIEEAQTEKNFSPALMEILSIPKWLRYIVLASPVVGSFAFLCILAHLISNVLSAKRKFKKSVVNHGEGGGYVALDGSPVKKKPAWQPTKRHDMVLLVIAMPAVFIVMAIRSTQRMLMIMRASDIGFDARVDAALYHENLQLAAVCQYYIVFVFSQLCMTFIKKEESSEEIQWAMKFAGFQGVYAWVICGTLRCIFDFTLQFLGAHAELFGVKAVETVTQSAGIVQEKVATVFSILTLLCVYNMAIICKMKYIKDNLGNASLKFMGTRLLLILSQIQLEIILKIGDAKKYLTFLPDISEPQALLLHSSLLTMECLLVVLYNWYAWERDVGSDLYTHLLDE